MARTGCLILFLLLLLSWPAGGLFAFEPSRPLRIGLIGRYDHAQSIPLGRQDIVVGYSVGGIFYGEPVSLPNNSAMIATNRTYAAGADNFPSLAEAQQARNMMSAPDLVFIHEAPGRWRIAYPAERHDAGAELLNADGRGIGLADAASSQPFIVFTNAHASPQVAGANGAPLHMGDRQYRGIIEFVRSGSAVTPVNLVNMDEYLYSVVPSEMPASWHPEALKAQAVAARSYTLTRAGVHESQGYQLCDTVHCQVYLGAGNEAASTTEAVNATSGILATHNGQVINATYFSSSGGATEHSEFIWPNAVPYLRSVREVAEHEYKQWSRSLTMADITALLQANNIPIGQAIRLEIATGSPSGRVTSMTVTGTNGSKTLAGGSIRTLFAGAPGGALESNHFSFVNGDVASVMGRAAVWDTWTQTVGDVILDGLYAISGQGEAPAVIRQAVAQGQYGTHAFGANYETTTFVAGSHVAIVGRGWGHGVGMSQYGAKGMAEAGYTYIQILKHYYTGIEVR